MEEVLNTIICSVYRIYAKSSHLNECRYSCVFALYILKNIADASIYSENLSIIMEAINHAPHVETIAIPSGNF